MSPLLLTEKKYRQALFFLSFTQLWESFSFYGMRVLLVLYLVSHLAYTENDAFAVYALYTSLIELGAFIGGYCADRFFGLRSAVFLGGIFICLGHLCLTFSNSASLFFLGLSFIICGASLFRSNLKALVGLLYKEDHSKCESGFTLFYTCTNIGGFAAALLCGYAVQLYGWSMGLGLAAVGMLISMIVFFTHFHFVQTAEKITIYFKAIPLIFCACLACSQLLIHFTLMQSLMLPLTSSVLIGLLIYLHRQIELKSLLLLAGLLVLLIFYFTVEELMGSLLMIFCEKHVDRLIWGFEIPSTTLAATNPLTIIIMGPILTYVLECLSLRLSFRFALIYICLAFACGFLYLAISNGHPTALQVMISFAAIAMGELLLVPIVYAACSQLGSDRNKGVMMATVALAFALASLFSGHVSQYAYQTQKNGVADLAFQITLVSTFIFILFILYHQFSFRLQGFYAKFITN